LTATAELPAPNDGGASASAVPQCLSGYAASEYTSVPPVLMSDSGSDVRSVAWPSTFRPLMYVRWWGPDAPGAAIRMDLPAGSAISARSKSGAPTVRIGVPGVAGYRPRAAHTYQAASAPRSSLPGSPSAVGAKSPRTRSTVR